MSVPILLDEAAHRLGFQRWLTLDYTLSPHILWAGRTGSGKTVAAKICLARTILLAPPELQPVETMILDPKAGDDFNFNSAYRGTEAPKGLNTFFQAFCDRQNGIDTSRNLKIMFVDEFASLLNMVDDKKEKEAVLRKLSLLLMLARSFRLSVQLATQQPNAQAMGNSGNREQFGAICLIGDTGSETKQMLFDGDSRERIKQFGSIGGRGTGWITINGGLAVPVRVPRIQSFNKLDEIIKNNVEENRKED